MRRYWIAVASREHVLIGVQGGFCQVCHGKEAPLKQMKEGDWIVYYSPNEKFEEKSPCQRFTAIGQLKAKGPYSFQISEDFIPWRRDVSFLSSKEAFIKPLLDELSFIKDKKKWGFPFRRGVFSVSFNDFSLIASAMGILIKE